MKSTISFVVFLLIFSPKISFGNDYYIATKNLNVRTGAGTAYSISFTLQEGDKVEVLSTKGNWYEVNYNGKIGFAYSKYLEFISPTETNSSQQSNSPKFVVVVLIILGAIGIWLLQGWIFEVNRRRRRDYYNDEYLKSNAWKRKRFVVLRRDNWRCKYCGGRATQVHHLKYAKYNIGKEPIGWLVSVCKLCHDAQHH